jgi:hypothetical protein
VINDAIKDFDVMMSESENGHKPAGTARVKAAAVEPEEVHWLWERRIPYGKLTIYDGDPDVGKSVITMDLAARVSTGRKFPDGATCEPANGFFTGRVSCYLATHCRYPSLLPLDRTGAMC